MDERSLPLTLPGADGPASVYVRPHDLEVERHCNGGLSWGARINRLVPLGGIVRLDLMLHDGTALQVQLTRQRCLELALARGEGVFVTPKDMKIFHESKSFVEKYVV
jgi:sulfate transport system ATP-binding protein